VVVGEKFQNLHSFQLDYPFQPEAGLFDLLASKIASVPGEEIKDR
jgi:hypothetical protein